MATAPPRRRDSPPALPVELLEEILLRLPPDDPFCILCASIVCKTWGGAISHPSFRRRLHEFYRTPPVLGFLHNWGNEQLPQFISTTSSPFSLAAPDLSSWRALDCRHGRALFLSKGQYTQEILLLELITGAQQRIPVPPVLWDPITGAQQRVPVPATFQSGSPNAAVLCAAVGCDHRDCHGGPFFLVFVFSVAEITVDQEESVTSACVYSSETGLWGELTSRHGEYAHFSYYSSVLVGSSLIYFMSDNGSIHEYDLATHSLNVFGTPDCMRSNLMLAEDGGLGVIQDFDPQQLKLWSREKTDQRWVLRRVIRLENLLPDVALVEGSVHVMGFAEGANVIFVTTAAGLFTIELQSERVKKVCNDGGFCNLIPVVSFYTPHSRLGALGGEHHYSPLPPSPTEEDVGGEEGEGEVDKLLEQGQELIQKCKAMLATASATPSRSGFYNMENFLRTVLEPFYAKLRRRKIEFQRIHQLKNQSKIQLTNKDDPRSSEASSDKHGDSEED